MPVDIRAAIEEDPAYEAILDRINQLDTKIKFKEELYEYLEIELTKFISKLDQGEDNEEELDHIEDIIAQLAEQVKNRIKRDIKAYQSDESESKDAKAGQQSSAPRNSLLIQNPSPLPDAARDNHFGAISIMFANTPQLLGQIHSAPRPPTEMSDEEPQPKKTKRGGFFSSVNGETQTESEESSTDAEESTNSSSSNSRLS